MSNTTTVKEFCWFDVLQELRDGKDISTDEFVVLSHKAQAWPTCACGQLCKLLPRRADGCPMDEGLRSLGDEFFSNIKDRNWGRALETFKVIEDRSTMLLEEQRMIEKQDSWVSACV